MCYRGTWPWPYFTEVASVARITGFKYLVGVYEKHFVPGACVPNRESPISGTRVQVLGQYNIVPLHQLCTLDVAAA